jgi:hypothetical protein
MRRKIIRMLPGLGGRSLLPNLYSIDSCEPGGPCCSIAPLDSMRAWGYVHAHLEVSLSSISRKGVNVHDTLNYP